MKRQLFYRGAGSPTSQAVVDFKLQGADALAGFLSRRFAPVNIPPADPAPLCVPQRLYDSVFCFPIHGHMVGPTTQAVAAGMFRLGVASVS
jgi:hypothetical protein